MTKTCPVCGKEFVVTRGRRYCSRACQRNAHRVTEKACPICGTAFPVARGRKYCSLACRRKAERQKKADGKTIRPCSASLKSIFEKRDRAYEALGVKVTTSVVSGRTVEWRGQRVCGMNSTWGRARY